MVAGVVIVEGSVVVGGKVKRVVVKEGKLRFLDENNVTFVAEGADLPQPGKLF